MGLPWAHCIFFTYDIPPIYHMLYPKNSNYIHIFPKQPHCRAWINSKIVFSRLAPCSGSLSSSARRNVKPSKNPQ